MVDVTTDSVLFPPDYDEQCQKNHPHTSPLKKGKTDGQTLQVGPSS